VWYVGYLKVDSLDKSLRTAKEELQEYSRDKYNWNCIVFSATFLYILHGSLNAVAALLKQYVHNSR
jgi:hypothetical protein